MCFVLAIDLMSPQLCHKNPEGRIRNRYLARFPPTAGQLANCRYLADPFGQNLLMVLQFSNIFLFHRQICFRAIFGLSSEYGEEKSLVKTETKIFKPFIIDDHYSNVIFSYTIIKD